MAHDLIHAAGRDRPGAPHARAAFRTRHGSGETLGSAATGYAIGRLSAPSSHSRVIAVMVSSSAVAGPSAAAQATDEFSQTYRCKREPTPGIEPGTSSLPRISLPALWQIPVDRERNASNYGVVGLPGPISPARTTQNGRSGDPYGPRLALSDHRDCLKLVAKEYPPPARTAFLAGRVSTVLGTAKRSQARRAPFVGPADIRNRPVVRSRLPSRRGTD